jgi:two-component sensor histidine kinase
MPDIEHPIPLLKKPPVDRPNFPLRCLPAPYHETHFEGPELWQGIVTTALRVAAMEVVVWDFSGREFHCSQTFRERLGLKEGEAWTDFLPDEEQTALWEILLQVREGKPVTPRHIRWSRPESEPRSMAIRDGMPERTGDSTRVLLLAQDVSVAENALHTIRDIHQKADERVAFSKTLLREVNHRLKNNLQIVCSLIHSHIEEFNDPGARNSFRDIEARVRMIAHLHDRLARGFDTLEGAGILRELAGHIAQTAALPPGRLELDLQEGALELEPARAMPFAMMANELLMNSIQHGTPGSPVILQWQGLPDGSARLTIRNASPAAPMESPSGLGLEIVRALCRQLGADFQSQFAWNQAVCHVVMPAKKGGSDA